MDEFYVVNLLKDELYEKQKRLDKVTDQIHYLRNKLAIETKKQDYATNKKFLDDCEKERRELRGQVSALRQAIVKLGPDGGFRDGI